MTKTGLQKFNEWYGRGTYNNKIDELLAEEAQKPNCPAATCAMPCPYLSQKPVPAGLVEEIKNYCFLKWPTNSQKDYKDGVSFGHNESSEDILEILSRYPSSPVQEESLEDLAARKNHTIIFRIDNSTGGHNEFSEQVARAYLASLPDLKGE